MWIMEDGNDKDNKDNNNNNNTGQQRYAFYPIPRKVNNASKTLDSKVPSCRIILELE